MLFRACNLEDARPAIDIITFSINYRYSKLAYDDLCNIIAKDMGQLQMRKNKAGNLCKYIPTYKVTLEMPSQTLHGWGRIYFTPTQVNLSKLQEWLWKFVAGDVEAMQNKVKLSRCELAYDFYIPGSGYVAHEGLAKRLWWYI